MRSRNGKRWAVACVFVHRHPHRWHKIEALPWQTPREWCWTNTNKQRIVEQKSYKIEKCLVRFEFGFTNSNNVKERDDTANRQPPHNANNRLPSPHSHLWLADRLHSNFSLLFALRARARARESKTLKCNKFEFPANCYHIQSDTFGFWFFLSF